MKLYFLIIALALTLMAKEVDPAPFKSVPMLAPSHINITGAYDHGTLYELQLEVMTSQGPQRTTAFVTKDKKVVLFGEAVNATTGETIKRPLDMASIRKNADLIYGTGTQELIVFTDPECSYCVKFERMWPSLEKNVKLYVFFMPLSNHRNAVSMSFHVMKQEGQTAKAKALLQMADGDRSFEKLSMNSEMHELFAQKIEDNRALAEEFGVRGTPSVFNTKGENVAWNSLGK